MHRSWRILAVLAGTGVAALAALGLWHFARPAAPVAAFSTTDTRLVPATYQLVQRLEARVQSAAPTAADYALLGHAYLQAARENAGADYVGQAEKAFDHALARDAQNEEAIRGMAVVFLTLHQFDAAREEALRAIQLNPHRSASHGILVDAYLELGRYEEAIAAAQRMVDLRPDLTSYSRVSYVRELHGDLAGATQAMQYAVSAASGNLENAAWCRVYLGHLYAAQGDLAAAEGAYRYALHQLPDYGHAHGGLGRVALARGDYAAAVAAYEAAVAAAPIPEYEIALGHAYEAAGHTEAAEAQFARAIVMLEEERAGGMDVDEELAQLLLERGQETARALRLAQGAFGRRPTVKNASILAWAYHQSGDHDRALALAETSLRLGTREPAFFYRAGVIAAAAGRTAEAKRYLHEALEINPAFSVRDAADARRRLVTLGAAPVESRTGAS